MILLQNRIMGPLQLFRCDWDLFWLLFAEDNLLMILQVLDPCLASAGADDQTDTVIVEYDDFVKV